MNDLVVREHRLRDRESPGASPAATPVHRALFSTIPSTDPTTAVVRRLRAAIGLGLLADKYPLPSEHALARQLGVSNFALREALRRLREQGLIVTRPGKRGGSFVRASLDLQLLAREDLTLISATELRDLGDWRFMLTSASAFFAAQRASESNGNRLRTLAEAVRSATTESGARSAYGSFSLELAAAGQSVRLSRAEFAMHEEFDWLLGLSLADPSYRERTATELSAVAEAVVDRNPERARAAAERHSAATTDSLVKLRLSLLAGPAATAAPHAPDHSAQSLADEVSRITGLIMTSLEAVAEQGSRDGRPDRQPDRLRTQIARAALHEILALDFPVFGLGFMAEPPAGTDGALWMAWWRRSADGATADQRHVLDPGQDDFYDYTTREFYFRPRELGEQWAQGPYVDYGGVDDYIMTFSVPVIAGGTFVGVVSADVLVADLERHLAPWLVATRHSRMLVNAEGRVLVSNSAAHRVGDIVAADVASGLRLEYFGWSVASPLEGA